MAFRPWIACLKDIELSLVETYILSYIDNCINYSGTCIVYDNDRFDLEDFVYFLGLRTFCGDDLRNVINSLISKGCIEARVFDNNNNTKVLAYELMLTEKLMKFKW